MKKRVQRSNYIRYVDNAQLLYSNLKTDSAERAELLRNYVKIIVNHKLAVEHYWIEATVPTFQINNNLYNHFCIDDPGSYLIKHLRPFRNAYSHNLVKNLAIHSSLLAFEELNDPLAKIASAEADGNKAGGFTVETTIRPSFDEPSLPDWFEHDRPFWRKVQECGLPFNVKASQAVMVPKAQSLNLERLSTEVIAALEDHATTIAEQALETFIRSLKQDELPGSRIDRRELIRSKARSMHIHTNDGKEEDSAILFNNNEAKLYYSSQNPSKTWTIYNKDYFNGYDMALVS